MCVPTRLQRQSRFTRCYNVRITNHHRPRVTLQRGDHHILMRLCPRGATQQDEALHLIIKRRIQAQSNARHGEVFQLRLLQRHNTPKFLGTTNQADAQCITAGDYVRLFEIKAKLAILSQGNLRWQRRPVGHNKHLLAGRLQRSHAFWCTFDNRIADIQNAERIQQINVELVGHLANIRDLSGARRKLRRRQSIPHFFILSKSPISIRRHGKS